MNLPGVSAGLLLGQLMNPNDVAPVLVSVAMSLVGIVFILVKHQQKMAMILHGKADPVALEQEHRKSLALTLYGPKAEEVENASEIEKRLDGMERQMAELKDLVHRQTLMLDTLTQPSGQVQEIRQRLGSE